MSTRPYEEPSVPLGIRHREWLRRRLLALVAELDEVASCDMPTSLRDLADEYEAMAESRAGGRGRFTF
jgi:hypothetical protein